VSGVSIPSPCAATIHRLCDGPPTGPNVRSTLRGVWKCKPDVGGDGDYGPNAGEAEVLDLAGTDVGDKLGWPACWGRSSACLLHLPYFMVGRRATNGAEQDEVLEGARPILIPTDWSSDGRYIIERTGFDAQDGRYLGSTPLRRYEALSSFADRCQRIGGEVIAQRPLAGVTIR